jgi:hypothetical protein
MSEWWIVSPEGDLIAELTHSEDFKPYAVVVDTVIGVLFDELDREQISGYRVTTGPIH